MDTAPDTAARLEEAAVLHHAGELDAATIYRMLLAEEPADFAALLHLATVRLQQDDPDGAVELTRRAVDIRADSAEAHSTLATALWARRQYEAAIERYEQALSIDPDCAEANYGLGTVLVARERLDEAIACFRRALAVDPDYAEAEFALGVALRETNKPLESEAHFRAALTIDPDYIEARHELGKLLEAMDKHAEALACFDAIIDAEPGHLASLDQRGLVLQSLGRYEEALDSYRRALAIRPTAETQLRLGVALRELGRIEAAHQAIERAIDLRPRDPKGYVALFRSKPISADDPYVAAIRALEGAIETLSAAEQEDLHFALGMVATGLAETDCAFRHFLEANGRKRRRIAYDERIRLDLHAQLTRMFDADFMQRRVGSGCRSALPVFIVGMPRSGSTLVEQILASHPLVVGGGERPDFVRALVDAGVDGEAVPFPARVPSLTADELMRLGELYIARLRSATPPGRANEVERVTDKMLENFAVVGLIHLALPLARIIWTRRDPVDTCLSCFTTTFADVPYACDIGELARYHSSCETMRAHWEKMLPAGVILEVQYEDLVRDFEAQARRIVAHCGLAWDPACLAFHATERPVRTASAAQVRQPIYQNSIKRPRPNRTLLQPLLDALGLVAAG